MLVPAIFPDRHHVTAGSHRKRRPGLLVGRRRRFDGAHDAHRQRIAVDRQGRDDDALEAAGLLGPGDVSLVAVRRQRGLRRRTHAEAHGIAARQRTHPDRAVLFPCGEKTARAVERRDRGFVAFARAQVRFRRESRRGGGPVCHITARCAAAIVFPHHPDRAAGDCEALAVGGFDMRENRRTDGGADFERRVPLPGCLRGPGQQGEQKKTRASHDLPPRNSSRVCFL